MTADDVKRILQLEPHPREGGFFRQIYQSAAMLSAAVFNTSSDPAQYNGPRRLSTAIYYLLEPGTFSEMHRLASDEVFHHYGGAPVEMLQLWPNGEIARVVLGMDLVVGQRPQVVVPRGVWQGSRVLPGSAAAETWALLGCTVSPGFDYADYETGTRAELTDRYPEAWQMIQDLTREGVH